MHELKPIKLHTLLGHQASWTEALWHEALTFVLDTTVTRDVLLMTAVLGEEPIRSLHKIDYLRQFRDYPPTLLLGAYDLLRQSKARRSR